MCSGKRVDVDDGKYLNKNKSSRFDIQCDVHHEYISQGCWDYRGFDNILFFKLHILDWRP